MDLAYLVLRLVVGLTFAGHGAQKLFGVLGGDGLQGTAAMFDRVGLRPGWLHARIAGSAELLGGLMLALGLLTPLAAAALIVVMTAAVLAVHMPNGFWNANRGYEYNAVLVTAAFALAGVGPGDASLDAAINDGLAGSAWAVGAFAVGLLGGLITVAGGRAYGERTAHRRRPPHAHPA